MNRRLPIFALLCAAAILLTGCEPERDHYGTDFRAQYGDFLRYSLGEDYQITLIRNRQGADSEYYSEWTARYTPDGADTPREFRYITYDYVTGNLRAGSEQQFSEYQLLNAVVREAEHAALQELSDQILSKYYYVNSFDSAIRIGMEQGVTVSCRFDYVPTDADKPDPAVTARAVDPESGLQVRSANLQRLVQDENFILCCETEITSDAADAAHFTEKAEQICADFLRETDAPKNYRFCVTRIRDEESGGNAETLFDRSRLEGIGELDAAAQFGGDNADIRQSMLAALTEHLNQKYGT